MGIQRHLVVDFQGLMLRSEAQLDAFIVQNALVRLVDGDNLLFSDFYLKEGNGDELDTNVLVHFFNQLIEAVKNVNQDKFTGKLNLVVDEGDVKTNEDGKKESAKIPAKPTTGELVFPEGNDD